MFSNKKFKYLIYYIMGVMGLLLVLNSVLRSTKTEHIKYSAFEKMVEQKNIQEVQFSNDQIIIIPKQQKGIRSKVKYTTNIQKLNMNPLIEKLKVAGVEYDGPISNNDPIKKFFIEWILPILGFMIIGRIIFGSMEKRMGSGVMSFGKNNAKIYAENETGKTFDDVAGQDEAKESLIEIVDFLHNPDKYVEIGAKLPKGALLVGPPGTGKTLLAKAVAGEAKVPFFSLSGSSFVEMFVGMGAARVRDLFKQAEEKAPCIVFIDEIDAIGKSRDGAIGGGNDEREQTLNQLLAEMDGFDASKGVVILAATNRPEVLDKALLRPGRFDRRVIVDTPDLKGRESILKVHAKEVKMSEDVNLDEIAKSTPGAVGADLANMVNEAALLAVKKGRKSVIQQDLEEAVEIIIAGKEKKDRIMSDKEKRRVAFHEVGHALVAALLKNTDPVHKITIIPRTMGALGYTMQLPEEEKYLVSKEEMMDQISVMLGGRAAEEVEFNSISTGASNDIEKATQTARNMVTIYGMTERFDMMALESSSSRYLDGRPVKNCSAHTESLVDEETLRIIKDCHKKSINILKENKELLTNISEKLIDKETLMGEEFMDIINSFKKDDLIER
ncbi:ATP-dependent zinc metalloprotease FtsH [Clostridium botulinum]|uniref:ATP-dependent zinc metalloprotease FtsH n=1 Tax=Clostridium botulinum C/D str. DC5 TaxID=1443128 RepID=A0A0A0I9V1_CLOBO|nr:ATP-dependent zinc metalloprotease FtsH [Clostridium botulinum]KEI01687.1 cell division protein FtsH [Clostridium botulinum C/D str. BKT75002]KEI09933.1 cell division protein FtsH [Clostridium botulinum C/D str. BKT2873]KGM94492.1 cell division protein FtsH [Clostridium botulinum D str. CCUG 7971]KGM97096.1 cell division protein FtsH [Clostridium botulinum C/D str. DC5]KOC48083.1 cell division protein FtsH [Clostridium botulinum]